MESAAEFTTKLSALLNQRLNAIESERRRLGKAVGHLEDGAPGPVHRSARSRSGRMARGDRQSQLIAELRKGSGTIAELKERLGLPRESTGIYAVARSLEKKKVVEKKGSTYSLREPARQKGTQKARPRPPAKPASKTADRKA